MNTPKPGRPEPPPELTSDRPIVSLYADQADYLRSLNKGSLSDAIRYLIDDLKFTADLLQEHQYD